MTWGLGTGHTAAGLETGVRGELNRSSSDFSYWESWVWEPWAGSWGLCVAGPGVSHTDRGFFSHLPFIHPHPVSLCGPVSWPSLSKTSLDIPGRPWALVRKSQAGGYSSPHLMLAQSYFKIQETHSFSDLLYSMWSGTREPTVGTVGSYLKRQLNGTRI